VETLVTVKNWGSLPIRSQEDVVIVRQSIRRFGLEIGLNLIDQTKIVTAASELARNAFIYGGGGEVHVEELEERGRRGLRLTFVDQGPGIADVEKAMKDGYTSGHGLGLGLGGAKRLANEFSICSEPDKGTRVVITKWKS
jgi:serine/threonine-protein kinase RsbT